MLWKFLQLLIFLLLSGISSSAQKDRLSVEIQRVDSLLTMGKMDEAETEVNKLYEFLPADNDKNYTRQKLAIDWEVAFVQEEKFNDRKALELAFKVADEAASNNLFEREFKTYLLIELIYEKVENLTPARDYLEKAFGLTLKHNLDSVKSIYFVRLSSYYRIKGDKDSAYIYAKQALTYANKYNNATQKADAYMLIGMVLGNKDYLEAIDAHRQAQKTLLGENNTLYTPYMYHNISKIYRNLGEFKTALLYNDSSLTTQQEVYNEPSSAAYKARSEIFEAMGNADSALRYYQLYHQTYLEDESNKNATEIKKITAQYENEKKESIIKGRTKWIGFLAFATALITIGAIFILLQNRKIKQQNSMIQEQLAEVRKLVGQKEILLSELQHRVKNNLQQMISLLDIQKDSIGHNDMEEAIRETQNRIQSMALLHSRLIVNDNLTDVDFDKYLETLSELVVKSYQGNEQLVLVTINSELKEMPIDIAIPLGQIVVELMSNSIRHAFRSGEAGNISIRAWYDTGHKKYKLVYADDGVGFDFAGTTTRGLGIEIINGLTQQVGGRLVQSNGIKSGFEVSIYF